LPGACHDPPSKTQTPVFVPSNRAATYWHSRTRNLSNTKFLTTPQKHHIEPTKTSKITQMNPHEIRNESSSQTPPLLKPFPSSPPGFQKMHCSSTVQTALKMRIWSSTWSVLPGFFGGISGNVVRRHPGANFGDGVTATQLHNSYNSWKKKSVPRWWHIRTTKVFIPQKELEVRVD